jgi:hypothetical protein
MVFQTLVSLFETLISVIEAGGKEETTEALSRTLATLSQKERVNCMLSPFGREIE